MVRNLRRYVLTKISVVLGYLTWTDWHDGFGPVISLRLSMRYPELESRSMQIELLVNSFGTCLYNSFLLCLKMDVMHSVRRLKKVFKDTCIAACVMELTRVMMVLLRLHPDEAKFCHQKVLWSISAIECYRFRTHLAVKCPSSFWKKTWQKCLAIQFVTFWHKSWQKSQDFKN